MCGFSILSTMRAQLLLIPPAIIAFAVPAQAKVYMSIEQAQQTMYPGAKLAEHFITLNQDQYNAIIDDSGVDVYTRNIKAWKTSTGDWFVVDQVRGIDDWITYAIAIDGAGFVQQIEVLECLDKYDGITQPGWRGEFYGKKRGNGFTDIDILSGATFSSHQMIAGVQRVLSTIALALQPSAK